MTQYNFPMTASLVIIFTFCGINKVKF